MADEDADRHAALRDDLKLASDINDWVHAGKHLFRVVERLGDCLPPSGPGPAAELSQLIAAADTEFEKFFEAWEEIIRPRLIKHEGKAPPPLSFL